MFEFVILGFQDLSLKVALEKVVETLKELEIP